MVGAGCFGRLAQKVAMSFLIVEAEGIPDVDGGRRVYGLEPDLGDRAVVKVMSHYHLQHHGRSAPFFEHHLRSVAAVSLLHCRDEEVREIGLSIDHASEREMIEAVQNRISACDGTPVFWDGARDVAVWLTMRAMLHGCRLDLRHQPPVEHMLGLSVTRTRRHHLAKRFGMDAYAVPDDEQNWQVVRQQGGLASVVVRCASNARATAMLWYRYRLVNGDMTRDEYDAVAEGLEDHKPTGVNDTA